ncbi:MAG: aldose 1-epimerase family protein [bacterium]
MARIFGQEYTRQELTQRLGDLSQLGGIRLMTLQDGTEAGVRIADVRTGSGLRFQVTLDRGMDISQAEYRGIPLTWRSSQGDVHPAYFDESGMNWVRSFAGGLMTGCGMTYVGSPCVDDGRQLGLHGRLSNIPAQHVGTTTTWNGDQCIMSVSGSVRESNLFGENLLLCRTIETELGKSRIKLLDSVVNEGTGPVPLMMLYHINIGWPLLEEDAELIFRANSSRPRDAQAAPGLDMAKKMLAPQGGYREQVFYHDVLSDADGCASVLLHNPHRNLGLLLRYRKRELPNLVQWKMMGEGMYVLGIEPANCGVEGRTIERERGTLQILSPAEKREFYLEIEILDGDEQINQRIQRNSV